MLTSGQMSTPTAFDNAALLCAGDAHLRGDTLADARPNPSIGSFQDTLAIKEGGIPDLLEPLDTPLGGMPVSNDGGCLAMRESNWAQALRTLGLN